MKTTIEIPDALHRQARRKALEEGTTLKELILTSLQKALRGPAPEISVPPKAHFAVDEEGWPVLKRKGGKKITEALLQELRDEEDI